MSKLKKALFNMAVTVAGLIVMYAVFTQIGLGASIVMTVALGVAYLTIDEEETKAQTIEEAE